MPVNSVKGNIFNLFAINKIVVQAFRERRLCKART